MKLHPGIRGLAVLALLCGPVAAAPVLRLSTSALVWPTGYTAPQTICATNAGDGTLALSASVQTGIQWLTVSVTATQCTQFTVDISSLPRAAYNIRDATHPTTAGETLILWAIGLGATNPPLLAGAAAPVNPPAVAVYPPRVMFDDPVFEWVTPSFSGLSGGSAGLYQVIVTVPMDVAKGGLEVGLSFPGFYSDTVSLVVQ